MNLNEQLLQEVQISIDKVNHIMADDELTPSAKQFLLKEEFKKQRNLSKMREEWNKT